MKMIGVWAERRCLRISAAVSKPSMSGMLTSSRITANSRFRISRSAAAPDCTGTRFWPSSSSTVWNTSSFSGRSSTIRMLAFSSRARLQRRRRRSRRRSCALLAQPAPQHDQQVRRFNRLGQVVPGAGLDAFLAVALHGLGRHRDQRQVLAARQLAQLAHGLHAVHLRHHDVHQHHVDVRVVLHQLDRVAPVLGGDAPPCPALPARVASAKMLRTSSSTISTFLPARMREASLAALDRAALLLRHRRRCRGAAGRRSRRSGSPANPRCARSSPAGRIPMRGRAAARASDAAAPAAAAPRCAHRCIRPGRCG